MTIAELVLLGAALGAIYLLLRPLQRWLEARLLEIFPPRRRLRRPIIDVTKFTAHSVQKKKDADD